MFISATFALFLLSKLKTLSSKILRYASIAFLTPFISEYFWELCMPPLIYVFENLAKPDTVLKYFSWPKENIFREFWWSKIRPKLFFLFAPLGTTLLNQIWNHCRIRARKTLLNEEVIFAVRQQLRHSMQSRFGMIILLFPRYQDLRGEGESSFSGAPVKTRDAWDVL